jgi:hypothetical protein
MADDWINCYTYDLGPYPYPVENYLTMSNILVDKLTDEGMLLSKMKAARTGEKKKDIFDAKFLIERLGLSKQQVRELCDEYDVLWEYYGDDIFIRREVEQRKKFISLVFPEVIEKTSVFGGK